MTEKLSNDKIQEVKQLSSEGKSQRKIAEIISISPNTVNKYLKHTEQTKQEMVENLTANKVSREDIKKLKLIEKFTPEQLKELLYQLSLSEKQEINENP